MTDDDTWYAHLREALKPQHVHLLIIGESAPDDDGDPSRRRFFYSDRLAADNLFRSVVDALYQVTKEELRETGKRPWLERLRADEVFLIDLSPVPVNRATRPARVRMLRESVPGCVDRALALRPDGVVLVSRDVHEFLAQPLRDAGLRVLNDEAVPFPLGSWRSAFVSRFRSAVHALESE